jgi:hypothetical protein
VRKKTSKRAGGVDGSGAEREDWATKAGSSSPTLKLFLELKFEKKKPTQIIKSGFKL